MNDHLYIHFIYKLNVYTHSYIKKIKMTYAYNFRLHFITALKHELF